MPPAEPRLPTPAEHRLEEELRVCDPIKVDHTRPIELARLNQMQEELAQGFEILKKYRLAVSVFGSSRLLPEDPLYLAASELAARLSKSGFAIITGGAGGIMEAANKGAFEAGGQSIGLNIALPTEQVSNKYLTETMTFNYFFTRKVMLSFASEAYVFFPGGFGTLDELSEILTLVQTRKIKRIPVILYGREYWEPLLVFFEKRLFETYGAIDKEDLAIYTVVDTVDEAYESVLRLVQC